MTADAELFPRGFPDCPQERFARAGGAPVIRARFKARAADFRVSETLAWPLDGHGEHVYLRIRKCGIATGEAMQRLARAAGLPLRAVGRAGLKDRQGVCRQWLSLHLPGRGAPDLSAAEDASLRIETMVRNRRKLRPGSHGGNHFRIRLRDVAGDTDALARRLADIAREGVPNYFGEQRFGRGGENVTRAARMLSGRLTVRGRLQRGLLLSAARAWLFNGLLSARVRDGSWRQYRPGDVMNLDGSGSFFVPEQWDEALQRRLEEGDIHPTGPLWGEDDTPARDQAAALETQLPALAPELCRGLAATGMKMQRRSLRLPVQALHYCRPSAQALTIAFSLPPGAYATAVLREFCQYQDEGGQSPDRVASSEEVNE